MPSQSLAFSSVTDRSAPLPASTIGRFVGESLSFLVEREGSKLQFFEEKTRVRVPLISTVDAEVVGKLGGLGLIYAYYRPKSGVFVGVKGCGGGCCGSKDHYSPQRRASVRCAKPPPRSNSFKHSDTLRESQSLHNAGVGEYPSDIVPFLKEKKQPPDPEDEGIPNKFCLDALALTRTGNTHLIDIHTIENYPQVWVKDSRVVAWTLVEILGSSAMWTNKELTFLRGTVARLVTKSFIDTAFCDTEWFFVTGGEKGKGKIAQLLATAREKDTDGSVLCEVELLSELFNTPKSVHQLNHWILKVDRDVNYLFDAYTATGCYPPATDFFFTKRAIESFLGTGHELELHLALDSIYSAIGDDSVKKGDPIVSEALTYLFQLFLPDLNHKSWRGYFLPLACIDWAVKRDKIAATLFSQIQLKLDTMGGSVGVTLQDGGERVRQKAQRVKMNMYARLQKK